MGNPGHLCPRCGFRAGHAISCARDGTLILHARIKDLEQERDEAQRNFQFMVDKAADKHLPAYREQGQKLARMEERNEKLCARVKWLEGENERALPGKEERGGNR